MLMSEFLDRVPECTVGDYQDANALYTALPNMDKDDFCMLYRVDVLLSTGFLENLREAVEEYENWCRKKPYFVKTVPGFHTLEVAKKLQNGLMSKLEVLRKVFNVKEVC